jgi:predicted enzyme related to lactoylglutathione lyase
MMGPIDLPVGRFAILVDPQGAAFAVIALSENAPPASA